MKIKIKNKRMHGHVLYEISILTDKYRLTKDTISINTYRNLTVNKK